jgi:predicted DNA-binding antitoxin AbrB/MazE fold protein
MSQILAATFEDGVFKPDQPPALADSARVRLLIEPIDGGESAPQEQSWATLQGLWNTSQFDSGAIG